MPEPPEGTSVAKQLRDMGVASSRVEVGDPVCIFIRDAHSLQVLLHHSPSLAAIQQKEKLFG